MSKITFLLSALTLSTSLLITTRLGAAFINDGLESEATQTLTKPIKSRIIDTNDTTEENNATSLLENLPLEISLHITSFLPNKKDVNNLSLRSKKNHDKFRSPLGLGLTKRVFFIDNQDDFTIFINKYGHEDILDFPLKLRGLRVTDETLSYLKNATHVDLWH